MIVLNTSTTVRLATDAACLVDVLASYFDKTSETGPTSPSRKLTQVTTATNTDIVEAPSTGTRMVKTMTIRNSHATDPVGIIVSVVLSGTAARQIAITLLAGEMIVYTDLQGWTAYKANLVQK